MEGETISVIIPAYNVAPWLPRCLDSILAQTYPKLWWTTVPPTTPGR